MTMLLTMKMLLTMRMLYYEVDQPSGIRPPGAVGGIHLQGARLPSDKTVELVQTSVLEFVNVLKEDFHL